MFQYDVIMMIALWCHGGGPWHNALFLTKVSNVNSWAHFTIDFDWNEASLLQARDTENNITG